MWIQKCYFVLYKHLPLEQFSLITKTNSVAALAVVITHPGEKQQDGGTEQAFGTLGYLQPTSECLGSSLGSASNSFPANENPGR